jgi:hypothetical protein
MRYKKKIGKRERGFCSHCAVQLLLAEHSIGTPKWGAEKIFLIVDRWWGVFSRV